MQKIQHRRRRQQCSRGGLPCWIGIHLPRQGTTGSIPGRARFHMQRRNWVQAPQLLSLQAKYWAATTQAPTGHTPQLLRPARQSPRSAAREANAMRSPQQGEAPTRCNRRKPTRSNAVAQKPLTQTGPFSSVQIPHSLDISLLSPDHYSPFLDSLRMNWIPCEVFAYDCPCIHAPGWWGWVIFP